MDRRLIDYLPKALHSVMEFAAIMEAQQPEIEKAWDALGLVMDNQFIDTATAEGVSMWEKELNITPSGSETLEQRKEHIKTAWTYGALYTYNWLVHWLKVSCGEDIQLPTNSDYVLHVPLSISMDYANILDNMREYVSANILIDPLILLTQSKLSHYVGAAFRYAARQTMQTPSLNTDSITLLTDECGVVLVGENNNVMYEEAYV